MNQPVNAIKGLQGFQPTSLPADQRASAPAPNQSDTGKVPLTTWAAIRAIADKLADGSALDDNDLAVMVSAVMSAGGRSEPRWSNSELGMSDLDVTLTVAPGCADGELLTCEACACMFRPYDDGDGIYVDRFVTATTSTGELDSIDPGEPSRGVCGADPDCACHQAPHYVPKAGS